VIQTLGTKRSPVHDRRGRADSIIVIGESLDELDVLVGANQRARVAGERDDRERSEHRVYGPALESQLAQVRAREERSRRVEKLGRHRMMSRGSLGRCFWATRHPVAILAGTDRGGGNVDANRRPAM
jgi:hypothetical protein